MAGHNVNVVFRSRQPNPHPLAYHVPDIDPLVASVEEAWVLHTPPLVDVQMFQLIAAPMLRDLFQGSTLEAPDALNRLYVMEDFRWLNVRSIPPRRMFGRRRGDIYLAAEPLFQRYGSCLGGHYYREGNVVVKNLEDGRSITVRGPPQWMSSPCRLASRPVEADDALPGLPVYDPYVRITPVWKGKTVWLWKVTHCAEGPEIKQPAPHVAQWVERTLPNTPDWLFYVCTTLKSWHLGAAARTFKRFYDRHAAPAAGIAYVYQPILTRIKAAWAMRSVNPWALREIAVAVENAYKAEPFWPALEKFDAVRVLSATTLCSLADLIFEARVDLEALRIAHAEDISAYNHSLRSLDVVPLRTRWSWKWLIPIAGVFMASYRGRQMLRKILAWILAHKSTFKSFFVGPRMGSVALLAFAVSAYFQLTSKVVSVTTYSAIALAAPFYEEPIKQYHWHGLPVGYVGFQAFEMFMNYCQFGPEFLQKYWATMVMHFISYVLGRMRRHWGVWVHFGWNALCVHGMHSAEQRLLRDRMQPGFAWLVGLFLAFWQVVTRWRAKPYSWSQFRDLYYFQPWLDRPPLNVDVISAASFPPSQGWVPRQTVTHGEKPQVFCEVMQCSGPEPVPPYDLTPSLASEPILCYLPTQVPVYSPASNDYVLAKTISNRILRPIPQVPLGDFQDTVEFIRRAAVTWSRIPPCVEPQTHIVYEAVYDAWHAHLDGGPKKSLATRSKDLVLSIGLGRSTSLARTEVFVKRDEVLLKLMDGRHVCMQPRAIANVDPLTQVQVGPIVYEATQRLAAQWPCDTLSKERLLRRRATWVPIYFSYGSKSTDWSLTRWMKMVLGQASLGRDFGIILVAGDDSLVIAQLDGQLFFIEGDASKFDQSQHTGALELEYRVLTRLGADAFTIEKLRQTAHAKYVARFKRGGYKWSIRKGRGRHVRPMRDTGGADTTFGNSVTMAHGWYYTLRELFRRDRMPSDTQELSEIFGHLGFDMKLRVFRDPTRPTFLKGQWWPTQDGAEDLVWAPLPSRFLKMGKSFRDPRELYGRSDLLAATKMFMNELANAYAHFARVPVVSAFVDRYKTTEITRGLPNRLLGLSEYQPEASSLLAGVRLDPGPALTRYGWDLHDLDQMEDLIRRSSAFTFLIHPGFVRMALIDYS